MKLVKAYSIFTSRKYRFIMAGLLVAVYVLNYLIELFQHELGFLFRIYVVALACMIPLYGDMEVFAGLHNKESGQIASVQSSFAGTKVMKLGILSDRIFMLVWVFAANLSFTLAGASSRTMNIFTLMTGTAAVYCLMTAAVNINRYFTTRWGFMTASVVETVFVDAAAVLLWVLLPAGNLLSGILGVLAIILAVYLTLLHAAYHLKRSYYDE